MTLLMLGRGYVLLSFHQLGLQQLLRTVGAIHTSLPLGPAANGLPHSLHTTAAARGLDDEDGGAPPIHKLRALPFTVSPERAKQSSLAHHQRHLLLAQPSDPSAKETFLPFWVTNAEVQVQVLSADVGHRQLVTSRNPSTGRVQSSYQTVWRSVTLGWSWERSYPPTDPMMQLYASYKYPIGQIQPLAPGPLMYAATQLTPDLLQSSDGETTRRVGPFQVPPAAAKHLALAAIHSKEMSVADTQLREAFQADEVRLVDLRLAPLLFRAHPVYVPAHVFSSWYYGVKLRTFVSGVDAAAVARTRVYDREKVGLLTGFVGLAAALVSGALSLNPTSWVYWFSASAAAGWLSALVHPLVAHRLLGASSNLRQWWHQQRVARWSSGDFGSSGGGATGWDAEWVHEYDHLGNAHKRQERRSSEWRHTYNTSSARSGRQAAGRDPLGYYKVLGVEPSCSPEELQAAFRGLALRHHPDRHTGAAQKAAATRLFQRITAAYQVLRSPAKRQQYDEGGIRE